MNRKICSSKYKTRNGDDWTLSSNNIRPVEKYRIINLNPATWYTVKVTAHNDAGITDAEYEFATLTRSGGEFRL